MSAVVATQIASAMPHLADMVGRHGLNRRSEEFERLGLAALWQLERDLALVERYVPADKVARAYGDQLRNAGQVVQVLYEVRVAAMLAPIAEAIEPAPPVGQRKCDLNCLLGGQGVFFEVTTANHEITEVPRSQVLRERIRGALRQLPPGEIDIVIVETPLGGRSEDVEAALYGDLNGLFTVPDEIGGASSLSAVIWMRLVPRFADVRVHSRWFANPRARRPPVGGLGERLQELFDRRAVLERECDRVKRVLVDRYHAERLILFGSLADADPDKVHQWSDLDLFIVKQTPRPFIERAGEILDLIEPRVAVNVLVYTPDEFERARDERHGFVVDEVVGRGRVLFP